MENFTDGLLVSIEQSKSSLNQAYCTQWRGPEVDPNRIIAINSDYMIPTPELAQSILRENVCALYVLNQYRQFYNGWPSSVLVVTDRRNESYERIEKITGVVFNVVRVTSIDDLSTVVDQYSQVDVLISFIRDTPNKMEQNNSIRANIKSTIYAHPVSAGIMHNDLNVKIIYPPFVHPEDKYLFLVGCREYPARMYKSHELTTAIDFHHRLQMCNYTYPNPSNHTYMPQLPGLNNYSVEFLLRELQSLPAESNWRRCYREGAMIVLGFVQ